MTYPTRCGIDYSFGHLVVFQAAREDRAMSGKGSEQPSHVGVRKAPSTGSLRINATKSLSFSFSGHGLGGGPEDMPASGEGAGDDEYARSGLRRRS